MKWLTPLSLCIVLSVAFLAVSCQSPSRSPECQEQDWYELGRRKGAYGLPASQKIKPICQSSDLAAVKALYQHGYYAGLVEFCTPENGFEFGRSGHTYSHVCPGDLEPTFLKRYRKGRHYYQLEKTNQTLDQQMAQLFSRIKSVKADPIKSSSLRAELTQLQEQKAENRRQLHQLAHSED